MMMLLFNVKQGAQTKTSNAVPNVTDNVKLVEETEAQTKLQQESQIKNNAPCDEATIVNHAVESEPASDAKHDVGIHLDIDQKIVERQQKSNARRLRQLKQDRSATYKKLKKIHGAITVLSHCIKHDFLLWNCAQTEILQYTPTYCTTYRTLLSLRQDILVVCLD